MVQGYMRQDNGGKGGWYSFPRLRKAAEEKCQAGSDWDVSSRLYVRILVELRMTNRLHIFQKNLSYHQEQKKLIEKQDGLS